MVASKRYSHAMYFVEPNLLHRPGFSVGEDHSFASSAWARSSSPRIVDARIFAVCMAGFTVEKGAQVVPGGHNRVSVEPSSGLTRSPALLVGAPRRRGPNWASPRIVIFAKRVRRRM
jgi:hypothetical protein